MQFNSFPPIVDIHGLSVLLNRQPEVIAAARCTRPYTLPPACSIPDTKKPLWIVEDVIQWLRTYEEKPVIKKTKMGAPTKAERVKKRLEAEAAAKLS